MIWEKIKRNHLLFMDDLKLFGKNEKQVDILVKTVRIFSHDIGMEFGISKCAVLIMNRGKLCTCEGIVLSDKQVIRGLQQDDGYKYLGILEADDMKYFGMKEALSKECLRSIRKILKSKQNSGNLVSAINARAVSLIRYGAGIIYWSKEELRNLDSKTRKLLSVYRSFHPQADVDRLYVKRSQGGRGLISVDDCVSVEVGSLHRYAKDSKEKLLVAVQNENILDEREKKERIRQERLNSCRGKTSHGQFVKGTENIRDSESWNWLKRGTLKKETEGLLTAAQDQALHTNYINNKMERAYV